MDVRGVDGNMIGGLEMNGCLYMYIEWDGLGGKGGEKWEMYEARARITGPGTVKCQLPTEECRMYKAQGFQVK